MPISDLRFFFKIEYNNYAYSKLNISLISMFFKRKCLADFGHFKLWIYNQYIHQKHSCTWSPSPKGLAKRAGSMSVGAFSNYRSRKFQLLHLWRYENVFSWQLWTGSDRRDPPLGSKPGWNGWSNPAIESIWIEPDEDWSQQTWQFAL